MRFRRHLKQVLEQGDPPAYQGGDIPGPVSQRTEMAVPGERHEQVGENQQNDGLESTGH